LCQRVTRHHTNQPDGKYTVLADRYQGTKLNSPNDVDLDPDGAIYFMDTTLSIAMKKATSLC
jgi:gluconolactonase